MDWFSGIVVYLIVWWTVLFTVLPFWVRNHDGSVAGADPGAPDEPRLKRKFAVTSLIAAGIWVVIYLVVASHVISFHEIAQQQFDHDMQASEAAAHGPKNQGQ